MNRKPLLPARLVLVAAVFAVTALSSDGQQRKDDTEKYFREAVRLYESGNYQAARLVVDKLDESGVYREFSEAYDVMCAMRLRTEGATREAEAFLERWPQSAYRTEVSNLLALSEFESGNYGKCLELSETIKPSALRRSERDGWHFRVGYSCFMEGYWERSAQVLEGLAGRKNSYSAPSNYILGYMAYVDRRFKEAVPYFEKSAYDLRFGGLSRYYITECRFMTEDYAYVTDMAESGRLPENLGGDYDKNIARIVSESYMAQGKVQQAGKYYESFYSSRSSFTRSDYFYAGMVAYGLKNYKDAVTHLEKVAAERDSLAQVALYYCGYSCVQTGNKLKALEYFQVASGMSYDPMVKEDAEFNYAKLAYDVNGDVSGFSAYIAEYPQSSKTNEIYGYMASASMQRRDYAAAVEAYRKMETMNSATKDNFRAALFLRSMQLASSGAYSSTIPLLKQVSRLKQGDKMSFLADYWLAEAYYRIEKYDDALALCQSLLRQRSFSGLDEYKMLQYNIGYNYFRMGQYQNASQAFKAYLASSPSFRKEAMLRNADCCFMLQDYEASADLYEKCADQFFDREDIYPIYQAAISYGLTGRDPKKISMLERVLTYSSDVRLYDEALYELGRSYVRMDDDVKAEDIFRKVIENASDSSLVAASTLELGSVYRNRIQYDRALEYYKRVVSTQPSSKEAQDALAAIESIYQTQGRPQDYLDYIESIGKSSMKSEDERESMFFAAAEQSFMKGDYSSALVSLSDFIGKYPEGIHLSQAYYYMAESYRNLGRLEKAQDAYYKVMDLGESSFAESATLNYAEIAYRLERYQQAYEGFATLGEISTFDNNKYTALLGVMRSRYMLKDYRNAIVAANDLMASPSCDEPAEREAKYIQVKSYIALSERDSAAPLLKELSANPDTPEGAEASYLLIQELYDSGRFDEVEEAVYAFSEKAPGQVYFLAKSFIVLGDAFAERDDWEQAKATFESIRNNYKAPEGGDDILQQVDMRLKRMSEMGLNESDIENYEN